jgi:hypothetical protein
VKSKSLQEKVKRQLLTNELESFKWLFQHELFNHKKLKNNETMIKHFDGMYMFFLKYFNLKEYMSHKLMTNDKVELIKFKIDVFPRIYYFTLDENLLIKRIDLKGMMAFIEEKLRTNDELFFKEAKHRLHKENKKEVVDTLKKILTAYNRIKLDHFFVYSPFDSNGFYNLVFDHRDFFVPMVNDFIVKTYLLREFIDEHMLNFRGENNFRALIDNFDDKHFLTDEEQLYLQRFVPD